MAYNSQSPEEQEIDLSAITRKVTGFTGKVSGSLNQGLQFLRKNIIILGVLFIIGAAAGFYVDQKTKIYDSQIIVSPNFGAVDYLYSKINLINAKISEGDTLFLKNVVGIQKPNKIGEIKIKPINDVYKFIENRQANFDMIKLMAEDGDIKKIIEDNTTSKNYPYHLISFTTSGLTDNSYTITPLLNFLNDSDYFRKIQAVSLNNIQAKMIQNDSIIEQINKLLVGFSKSAGNQNADKLVYFNNESTQLNDIIKTKNELINEQAMHRLELVSQDKIIKESTVTINARKTALIGKAIVFPVLLILAFIALSIIIRVRKSSATAGI